MDKQSESNKKRIIIICYGIGGASGLVFERLINQLNNYYDIDLFVSANNPNIELNPQINVEVVRFIWYPKFLESFLRKHLIIDNTGYLQLNGLILKLIVKYFGNNPLYHIWTNRIYKRIKKRKQCYSLVFGLMDYNGFPPLIATKKIGEKLNLKTVVYSTDANPVPEYWDPDVLYLKKATQLLSKFYPQLDGLYFSNPIMTEYEDSIFSISNKIRLGYFLTNSPVSNISFEPPVSKMFLYTGSAWGPRKLDFLFKAFKKLLSTCPDAVLCFVGTRENGFSNLELSVLNENERKSVISYPRLSDKSFLEGKYKEACCFIDLNACVEFDPFLSSKITNYILYNRPIICETGRKSPARFLFSGLDSVYLCDHDVEDLYNAMHDVVLKQNDYDFSERTKVINDFSLETIVHDVHMEFEGFINK